jgi:hypothetical protein
MERTSELVLAWVREQAVTTNDTAAEMWRRHELEFGGIQASVRKISDIVKKVRESSSGEPWSWADADGPDAVLMLSMFTEMIDDSAGSYPRISRDLAHWMIRIRRAAEPSLPAGNVAYFATLYLRRQRSGEPTDDLDAFLAFAPWRSAQATRVYQLACKRKAVRPLTGMMGLHPSAGQPASPELAALQDDLARRLVVAPSDQVKRRKAVRKVNDGK